MKLLDIKSSLLEQFFHNSSRGVDTDRMADVFISLKNKLASMYSDEIADLPPASSQDASKAFGMFTKGHASFLIVIEDDGPRSYVIFAAARIGKQIYAVDLTTQPHEEKPSDLKSIRTILRQAKNLNDEVYFKTVTVTDSLKHYLLK